MFDRMQATLSILAEMMSSMEKSKAALQQLSSLHLQGGSTNPPALKVFSHSQRRSPEHEQDAAAPAYRRSSRELGRQSGTPAVIRSPFAHSDGESGSPLDNHKAAPLEPPLGYNLESRPLHAASARGSDEHDDVLSFEDLSNTQRDYSPVGPSHQRFTEPDSNPNFSLRTKADLIWHPDNSLSSSGAKLSAAYAEEKAHDDFSSWNKQLSSSVYSEVPHGSPLPTDAKGNLQSQLFDAADTVRRATMYNSTLALTPQGGKSQQFQYSSSGYIWEGVRFNRAQGPVVRLCYVSGPLVKVTILLGKLN